jgi:hypothetical protein
MVECGVFDGGGTGMGMRFDDAEPEREGGSISFEIEESSEGR